MEPWYKVAMARPEVRESRSFRRVCHRDGARDPGTEPESYRDPVECFSRTYFTRAVVLARQ